MIDVDLGRQVPRAWLAMPGRPVVDAGSGGSGRWGRKHHLAACDAPARFARRVLAAQTRLPIVIAGDRPSLERVATLLPQRSLQHLVAEIEIGGELADTAAVEQACALMRDRYDRHGVAMGRRLNRGLVSNGDALAGPGAALDALDAGIVKTLLVTQEPSPDPGWHCQSCGHVGTHESLPGRCRRCGHEHVKPWLAPVELVRLAVQGGVNVLVTPEHVLRDYGGIACVLTETGMLQALPAPHAPRLVA